MYQARTGKLQEPVHAQPTMRHRVMKSDASYFPSKLRCLPVRHVALWGLGSGLGLGLGGCLLLDLGGIDGRI